jgi:predicted Zn-dependent protease
MEIDMSNTIAVVEVYLLAKDQFDKAEAILKQAKADAVNATNGYGYLEGVTADLDISLRAQKRINEQKLLDLGLTQAQIDACKVEGAAFPYVSVKPKKPSRAKVAA